MVDVSKRLSGSPKVQPKPQLKKKWMSEPNLLGDDDDEAQTWIKERDNMEEEGVSFTEEVPELSHVSINKQRVQLRPRRRPPTRDFVRSRASMDFDISLAFPEEIEEEDEDVGEREDTETQDRVQSPLKPPAPPPKPTEEHTSERPTPPPKPAERNGWRFPNLGSEVVLRKTKTENTDEAKSDEIEDNVHESNAPESSPEKKRRERRRFKVPFPNLRRSRKGRQNGNNLKPETERKTNLTETQSMSVDSGARPLGENPRRRWPNRHRKSEEKGLNWLLGLFHKRSADGPQDTSKNSKDVAHATGSHGDTNSNGTNKPNGSVPEVRVEGELTNGDTSHEVEANETPENVSDIRKKFERLSVAF